jgi:hypothetical protein
MEVVGGEIILIEIHAGIAVDLNIEISHGSS